VVHGSPVGRKLKSANQLRLAVPLVSTVPGFETSPSAKLVIRIDNDLSLTSLSL
jgi:hypothetical protein